MSDQALTPEQAFAKKLQTGCHALVDGFGTSYGYVPSLGAGVAFLVLFGLSFLVHTVQAVWKRSWWTLVFSVGCICRLSLCAPRRNIWTQD